MTLKFSFVYKGFEIDVAVTHGGDSVKIEALVSHPQLPSADEIFALIMSGVAKVSNK